MKDKNRYKVLYMVKYHNEIQACLIFNGVVSQARAHRLARNYSKRHNIKVRYYGSFGELNHDMTGTK